MHLEKKRLRQRLQVIADQVKSVKQDMVSLKMLHRQFNFVSLLPTISHTLKKCTPHNKSQEAEQFQADKQNISINITKKIHPIKIKSNNRASHKNTSPNSIPISALQHNSSQKHQIKDLKVGLMLQLSQIRSMDKKSQSLRRVNSRIKQYNQNQRNRYKYSNNKDKDMQISINLNDISHISQKSTTNLCEISSIIDSKVQQISSLSEMNNFDMQQTLKCKKGHQFYQGYINKYNQPQGNGRLQVCCNNIAQNIGCNNLKDTIFYQGRFKNGRFNGFGTLCYLGGIKYVGQFKQGNRHGRGSMYCNGKGQVANWHNDIFISII